MIRKRLRLGVTAVRYMKALVGLILIATAFLLSVDIVRKVIGIYSSDITHSTLVILSDVLLVLVLLELAKTIFSYIENDEAYLHSILETAFIAVLREVILIEVRGFDLAKGLVMALLVFAIGYVYYKMYTEK